MGAGGADADGRGGRGRGRAEKQGGDPHPPGRGEDERGPQGRLGGTPSGKEGEKGEGSARVREGRKKGHLAVRWGAVRKGRDTQRARTKRGPLREREEGEGATLGT